MSRSPSAHRLLLWLLTSGFVGCDVRIDVDALIDNMCLNAEVVTGRSFSYPVSAFVLLVEEEPYSFFRNVELQNLLYRISHDHGLVRHVDPRFENEISFYPRFIHKSCGPVVTLWTSDDGTCAVVEVMEKAGIWSDETIQFFSEMESALGELHGQTVVSYLQPDKSQNAMWRLDTGPPEDPYGGKLSMSWDDICGDLRSTL